MTTLELYVCVSTTEPSMATKREIGFAYRVNALRVLSRLGYATTRQLARLILGGCDANQRKMVGRTLRWLSDNRYIVLRRNNDSINGEQLSALTTAGARWLLQHQEVLPGRKAHGRDWLRHAHSHRTACNSVFAAFGALAQEDTFSELEVREDRCPISKFKFMLDNAEYLKIPDLVRKIETDEDVDAYEWIEVENSWRNDKDLLKMVNCMRAMFYNRNKIFRVRFVVTSPAARSIQKRITKLMTHKADSGFSRIIRELDARILRDHLVFSELDHENLTLESLNLSPAKA